MKKFLPLVFVLAVFTAGAAIALTRTIHYAAAQAGLPVEAAQLRGTYLVPNCQPLCDLLTY